MGETKDAIMGFTLIIFIIGLIVTVVVLLLPEEPKENQKIDTIIKNKLYDSDNDGMIIDAYDGINTYYTAVLLQCRTINSFSDYIEYADNLSKSLEIAKIETDATVKLIGKGYLEHDEIGYLIEESSTLKLKIRKCSESLIVKYG